MTVSFGCVVAPTDWFGLMERDSNPSARRLVIGSFRPIYTHCSHRRPRSEGFESRSIKPEQSVGSTQPKETVIGLCQTDDLRGSAVFEGPGLVTHLQVR